MKRSTKIILITFLSLTIIGSASFVAYKTYTNHLEGQALEKKRIKQKEQAAEKKRIKQKEQEAEDKKEIEQTIKSYYIAFDELISGKKSHAQVLKDFQEILTGDALEYWNDYLTLDGGFGGGNPNPIIIELQIDYKNYSSDEVQVIAILTTENQFGTDDKFETVYTQKMILVKKNQQWLISDMKVGPKEDPF